MPLWFLSCHRRSLEKTESLLSIRLSPFPPFAGLSNSASARNPFFNFPAGGIGCGVTLPNNSAPLSILPLPLRSNASQASTDPGAVHENRLLTPKLDKSNSTPPDASVKLNPLPAISIRIGVVYVHSVPPGQ